MIAAFTGTSRNTNACESYFGSMKYYEDMFHCGIAGANAVVAAKNDELFDVLAPKFQFNGKRRVDDDHASRSTQRKRRRQSARSGRLEELGAQTEGAMMEVARTTGAAQVCSMRAASGRARARRRNPNRT